MKTQTEYQLEAKVTDLEYALSQVVAYLSAIDTEAIVTEGKAQFGNGAYAYATGSLGSSVKWARDMAQRALDRM
jgi:hypothetical protein